MRSAKGMWVVLLAVGLVFMVFREARSMPNFARKYGVGCLTCHNPVPRLNEFGFKFRAAGYRMPDEIGKDVTSTPMTDHFAGRLQARYDLKHSKAASGAASTSNQLTFHEVTLYPATGSWGKHFSSLIEMSFAPDEFPEIENAYVRYVTGTEDRFFTLRMGIFHPFEGYGASDRPLGLSRPLIQGTPANFNQSTFFKPWGFDQAGFELGYTVNNTAIRFTVFNGLFSEMNKAEPAQGGDLKKEPGSPSYNRKDFQIFVTHLFTDNGGGISAYFYSGSLDLPTGMRTPETFQDTFQRYAIYGSYPVQKALILAGYQYGKDKAFNYPASQDFNSAGFFGELDYNVSDALWLGGRFDEFDPATKRADNEALAISAFANYSFNNGLQFIGEYKHKSVKQGASAKKVDDTFQLRLIFIL